MPPLERQLGKLGAVSEGDSDLSFKPAASARPADGQKKGGGVMPADQEKTGG
jgi:hypothetical protein